MNAGDFRWQVDILAFTEVEDGQYAWTPVDRVWAKMERQSRVAVYAKYGVSADSIKFTIHSRPGLSLHNALRFVSSDNEHCFLTGIDPSIPGFLTLTVALTAVRGCVVERTKTTRGALNRPEVSKLPPLIFPGIVTEKWIRQEQSEPMSYSETRYILVTPKVISVEVGELVRIDDREYEVVIPHTLDSYKNEYEVLRRGDN